MRPLFTFAALILISALNLQSEVIDSAGMFRKDAIDTANRKISEIKNKSGKDFVLETVNEIGSENSSEFALKKARERKVNGVYILIAKKEKKVEVKTGSKTSEIFGGFERQTLRSRITEEFKAKNFDQGLTSSVDYFGQVISSGKSSVGNFPQTRGAAARESSSSIPWMTIILFGLGGFIIFRIIKGLMNRNNNSMAPGNYNQQPGYGQGGGMMGGGGPGIFGTVMAGMFGAVAGSWLYDKFSGGGGLFANDHTSHNSDSYSDSGSSWSSPDDGNNYSGDSGSWGDSGGGGDYGGGDSGGGDW
ncbi:MAG: TPM domain-containing protein [Leptospira sp.]|nr:TPM domain-containing protein [Leptospira sp.]